MILGSVVQPGHQQHSWLPPGPTQCHGPTTTISPPPSRLAICLAARVPQKKPVQARPLQVVDNPFENAIASVSGSFKLEPRPT